MKPPRRPVSPAFAPSDDASSRPTALEHRPVAPQRPPDPITDKRPAVELDETVRPTAIAGHRVVPALRRFRLVAPSGSSFECTTGACDVGSHPLCAWKLNDPSLSRFHCEVRLENNRALVRDLGSTNGTLIEGVRVREAFLKHGDKLTLGNVNLRFELDEATVERAVSPAAAFGALVGDAPVMRAAFHALEALTRTDAPFLLVGEPGTGRTTACEGVHQARAKGDALFLAIDCGRLPVSRLAIELLGDQRLPGVFQAALGGTVLLRELGELPLELQARLVRAMDDLPAGTRVAATSSRDLRPDVNTGRVRSDLYARFAAARVTMPPLREHSEDVPSLAGELLRRLGASAASHPGLFTSDFFARVSSATWRGNVLELRDYLEQCIAFEPTEGSTTIPAPPPHHAKPSFVEARTRAGENFERQYLGQLLARHNGRVAPAAAEAKVDRATLVMLLRKHAIPTKG